MSKLQALVCTECGGHIDRETMTCRFCGIQYKLDQDMMPIVVSRFDPNMVTVGASITVPYEMVRGLGCKDASEYAMKDLTKRIAEALVPYLEVTTYPPEPRTYTQTVEARVRVYRPDYRFGD